MNKYDKIRSVRGREKKTTLVQTPTCTPNEKYFVIVKTLQNLTINLLILVITVRSEAEGIYDIDV